MARIQTEIILPHGMLKKLREDCGVCELTARMALRGAIDSPKAQLIRKRALERFYGVERKK